jgi:hypothetical protein
MSSPNNNADFKLSELFNVKDKVVVVSGQPLLIASLLPSFLPDSIMQAVAQVSVSWPLRHLL